MAPPPADPDPLDQVPPADLPRIAVARLRAVNDRLDRVAQAEPEPAPTRFYRMVPWRSRRGDVRGR